MRCEILIIAVVFALVSCTSGGNDSSILLGKWSLYQDQDIYTEVWVDEHFVVLIDDVEDVHFFSYSMKNDSLSLTELGQPEEHSLIEQVRHFSVVKNVLDRQENNWVTGLKWILEKDIALSDTVFRIDTTLGYRQKVIREFSERYKQK